MYTLFDPSPTRASARLKAHRTLRPHECSQSGVNFRFGRSNQRCYQAECSAEACKLGVKRRRQRPGPRRNCAWCGFPLKAHRNHDYCGVKCHQTFNNCSKSWGPQLVKELIVGWYRGRRVGLGEIWQIVVGACDNLHVRRTAFAPESKSRTVCPPASTKVPLGVRVQYFPSSPRPPYARDHSRVFSLQAVCAGAAGDAQQSSQEPARCIARIRVGLRAFRSAPVYSEQARSAGMVRDIEYGGPV